MTAGKRLTQEEFVQRCKQIHNNKYDYTLVQYKNYQTPVIIICPDHGKFLQKAEYHMLGHGCKICANINNGNRCRKSLDTFIKESNKVHKNKYDYSQTEYRNWRTKVIINCPEHGNFYQTPSSHTSGNGCPKCAAVAMSIRKRHSTKIFVKKATKVHGLIYDYSLVDYAGDNNQVKIICPTHGAFLQKAGYHLSGYGCQLCSSSKGELKIISVLSKFNIEFVYQKRFKNCRNVNPLPFDFYLPQYNLCIEFDGLQHYKVIPRTNTDYDLTVLEQVKLHDQLKDKFCNEHNINLIRIPYWEFDNIEDIVKSQLKIE